MGSVPTITAIWPAPVNVLNALRHQRWDRKLGADTIYVFLSAQRLAASEVGSGFKINSPTPRLATCSTPCGIRGGIGGCSGSVLPLFSRSAQRLAASEVGSVCEFWLENPQPPPSAQRLAASEVGSEPYCLLRRSEFRSVLNALRHQRWDRSRCKIPNRFYFQCSTPCGIRGGIGPEPRRLIFLLGITSAQRLAASEVGSGHYVGQSIGVFAAKCSTPCGIRGGIGHVSGKGRNFKLKCAQRLAASEVGSEWKEFAGRRENSGCSTPCGIRGGIGIHSTLPALLFPTVLNALRHQRWDRSYTRVKTATSLENCAQRLAASEVGSERIMYLSTR